MANFKLATLFIILKINYPEIDLSWWWVLWFCIIEVVLDVIKDECKEYIKKKQNGSTKG